MSLTITEMDRVLICAALRREADRLKTALEDYRQARTRTNNAVLRAMADEGRDSAQAREKELRRLADLIAPLAQHPQEPQPRPGPR